MNTLFFLCKHMCEACMASPSCWHECCRYKLQQLAYLAYLSYPACSSAVKHTLDVVHSMFGMRAAGASCSSWRHGCAGAGGRGDRLLWRGARPAADCDLSLLGLHGLLGRRQASSGLLLAAQAVECCSRFYACQTLRNASEPRLCDFCG